MQEALRTRLDMRTAYHPQTDGQKVGEGQLIGHELVQETTEKISQIKDRLKAVRDHVVRFGKTGKLAPTFVGPFDIIEKVGPVAYRLDLPEEQDGVHDTFHVSNLKKCLADPTLQVPLDEIRVDAKLNFVKELVEVLEREFKKLKRSRIAIVKVRWNSKCGPEFTADHAAYTDRYVYGLTPQIRGIVVATEPQTIQKAMQIAGTLTDEALRNGSIKKNPGKRGNEGEPSKDRNVRDDNKRTRTGNAFAITANPIRRGYTGTALKCTTCNYHHSPETPCRTYFNCNRPRHFAKDCRVVPRNVNPINAKNPVARTCYECGSTKHIKATCPRLNQAQRLGGNHQNQVVVVNEGHGRGNQENQARGRAFMLGAKEARQDPNIVTGTFTLNDHYATALFDSGADYSFVSTTFIPLLQSLGSGDFNMIIGMDWLYNHKAKIICYEKVVRIPLSDGKVLRVIGEISDEKVRNLVSAKAKEQKREELVVVRDFPEVFLDDLSGLPLSREIKFRIELVPGAIPVARSPYRLAPSEMEELSGQLREL
ncbi:reverse transcriptase domain-containing protein [Tanacetum coccineum]